MTPITAPTAGYEYHLSGIPSSKRLHLINRMPARRDYTVYEAVNKKRREIFVGVTRAPIFEAVAEMRDSPPWRAGRWGPTDPVNVRSLEFGMTLIEAKAFAAGLASAKPPKGWRRVG